MKICSKDLRAYPKKEIGYAYRKIYNFFRFKKKQLYTTVIYKTDSFSKSLNVICLDSMNNEAIFLLSLNAEHNLRRNEALINIAVVDDKIIIPPIYGDCYQSVFKYKKIVKFIMKNIPEQ